MRLCFSYDDNGNASIDLGDNTAYYNGICGAIVFTGQNEVPMNPKKGAQVETVLTMEDNIEELQQMMLAGTLFPSFAENSTTILLTKATYKKSSNTIGTIEIEFMTQYTLGTQAVSVDIALR